MNAAGPGTNRIVFLFDVDNALLDNDRVVVDLKRYLMHEMGNDCANQYIEIFEQLRSVLGYSDYLGALQRYRLAHPHDPHLFAVLGDHPKAAANDHR